MIRRRFGRTNLQMPVLSCGGMRYQHKWGDVPTEQIPKEGQANLEATIRRAVSLGINHIETARGYGSSEMQLGWVLPSLPRQGLIVQTKVAPMEDGQQFIATFEKSMSLLRLDYVDLLAIHGINDQAGLDMSLRKGGCLEAARSLQRQGRCRFVGFSTHGNLEVILRALRHEEHGGFDYVNLHWYYILQRNWPAIEEAARRDMGVFIISPSDKGGKLYAPPPKLADLCRPLHPITFNDLFCLSHPQVHTLSIGAARPSDFDEHLATLPLLDQAGPTLAPILQRLGDAMEAAVGVRHPEAMTAGLPEHEHCPGGMNLQMILWLRAMALGWDMVDYGKMRYNLLGNGGNWFPGQNAGKLEELGSDAVRRAAAGSPWAPRVVDYLREAHDLLGGQSVKRQSQS